MKNVMLTLGAAMMLFMAGCGNNSKPTLNIFSWSEYLDPELEEQFEKEYNCEVIIDIFDSNESMWAKIQSGASKYDIIVPSSYMVKIMSDAGVLREIDKSKLPNLKNIDPKYLDCALDKDMKFGVPYMLTYTGIAYRGNDAMVGEVDNSWNVFATRSDLKGRMTLLADMRETIGAALIYKGYSINTTDDKELAEARDVVIEWKRNIAKFEAEQYKVGIANKEFLLVHGYSGDIGQAQLDDEDIKFFLPKEGFVMSCDEMVIPNSAEDVDLAYAFINFIHDGKVAAQNMEYTTYWCPNTAAVEFLPDEVKENPCIFPNPEDLKRGQVIGDVGENLVKYTKTWDEIKSSK